MSETFDIAIVGAGPAGATLARLLAGRFRVLVVDKRPLDLPRPCAPAGELALCAEAGATKCCGGLLATDAQRMLACLGLSVPPDVLGGPQLFAVQAVDLQTQQRRLYQRHYLNIDREKLDRHLVAMIGPRVDLRCECRLRDLRRDERGGIELDIEQDGRTVVERCRLLIGADGANSIVRRLLGKLGLAAPPAPQRYVAVQEWFHPRRIEPYYWALFDTAVTDFYGWIIPKGEHLILGAALAPGRNMRQKMELLKSRLQALGLTLGPSLKREACYLLRPRRASEIFLGQELSGGASVALVGEAAGLISPSSAEGISFALASAMHAAEALACGAEGFAARYRRLARRLVRSIQLKTLKCPCVFDPRVRNLLMKLGIGALKTEPNLLTVPYPGTSACFEGSRRGVS